MSNSRSKARKERLEWPYVTFSEADKAWKVDARTKQGGSRKFFKTKAEAETFAAQCRITRSNEGISPFGNVELAKYGKTVQWAIEFALTHLRAMEKSVSVSEAMEELIASRRAAGRSEHYCWDLRHRLSRFQKGFAKVTVATITAREIDQWLAALPLAPGTRNTFRRDICTLFSFCEKRGYCQKNEAEKTERAREVDKPAGILTLPQVGDLLSACGNDLIPYVAISLFAGLRAAEVKKLDWAEVDLDGGHIEVTAAKSKTARRRLVPISANLALWIRPFAKTVGPVTPIGIRKRFEAAKKAAGFVALPSNAMRHSFASYRLAQCQDTARVALEMGNSPAIVFAHYRELVKPKDAERYWNIKPTRGAGNVVAFQEAAA